MAKRPASIVRVGGFRPAGDPFATNFALKPLALPGETWPLIGAAPMLFVCQLNLQAAPTLPPLLQDIALLTFFVNPELSGLERENGVNWQLRAYPSLENLAPLEPPPGVPALKRGFECRWEAAVDRSGKSEDLAFTKVGGYPTEIQSPPWWEDDDHPAKPEYCLQINSEEKVGLFWGDAGMVYLARGTAEGCTGRWFLDWQCF
jgi:uncharacterized protein YwqG